MLIKNMFAKDIGRDIKGVIKVGQGDDENVKQELSEYVVTRELQKHFADFFANYKVLQNIQVKVGEYHPREDAIRIIEQCREAYSAVLQP